MDIASYDALQDALRQLKPGDALRSVSVTPELAGELLKHNQRNREVSEVKANIAKLTRAMRAGFWNPDPIGRIAFYADSDGVLADGQCRLHAVLDSGLTIVVDIDLVQTVLGMDEGRPR